MSAGAFEDGRYESDANRIYACRVQPETKGLVLNAQANAYPTEQPDSTLGSIRLRVGRRTLGIVPRTVTVELTADGTGAQAEYREGNLLTLPVFVRSRWVGYGRGQTGTYLGIPCRFAGKAPEITR